MTETDAPPLPGFGWGWSIVAAVALGALALWFRMPAMYEPLWLDELHTAWTVAGWSDSGPQRAAMGNNLPSYFQLLSYLAAGHDMTEFDLRWPSLLAGLLILPLMFVLVRQWTGQAGLAWAATLMVCLNRDFVFYASEARPYALVQLLATVQLALLPGLLATPTWTRRGLVIVLFWVLFHLHPTSGLLVIGWGVCNLIWRSRPSSESWFHAVVVPTLLDIGLIVAGWLPALQVLLPVFHRRHNWHQFIPESSATFSAWLNLLHLPSLVATACACWFAAWCARRWRRSDADDRERDATVARRWKLFAICLCWTLLPLTFAWLTTRNGFAPLLARRYLWSVAVGPIVLATLLLAQIASRPIRLASTVLWMAVMVSNLSPYPQSEGYRHEPWDLVTMAIRQADSAGEIPLLLRPRLIETAMIATDFDHSDTGDDQLNWHQFCLFPLQTPLYPVPHTVDDLYVLDDDGIWTPPSGWIVEAHRVGSAWMLSRGRNVTRTSAAVRAVESALAKHTTDATSPQSQAVGRAERLRWTRTLDRYWGYLRLVRWTHVATEAELERAADPERPGDREGGAVEQD